MQKLDLSVDLIVMAITKMALFEPWPYLEGCAMFVIRFSLLSISQQLLFSQSKVVSPTSRAQPLYLYPPGTGWPSYPPGIGFPFRRLLQLAGPRWRYPNWPPRRDVKILTYFNYVWYVTYSVFLTFPAVQPFSSHSFTH
jgi:hypothetical protein